VANFNPVSDVFSRFPKTQLEGDIPKMALVTGGVDALECSLRKIGIADTEFTDYTVDATGLSSPGRISLFEGAGNSGAKAGATVHTENQLVGSTSGTIGGSLLGNYNVLLLPCQGTFGYTTADGRGNAITFAGEGGRIFATHHSDTYLDQDAAIDGAATWLGDANSVSLGSGEATINTNFSSGMTLAQWLQDIGSTSTLGQVAMTALFNDQSGVNAPTQSWATLNGGESPILQLSFYTPVGSPAADQFGRVMYNEYHVDSTSTNSTVTFPAECTGGLAKTAAFTPQEHMLEYSLFDLMNFAVPVVAPTVSVGITTNPSTFTGGQVGDTVMVTVQNTGSSAIPTTPQVFLTVTLPAGLTPVAMTDADGIWSCTPSTLTCTLITAWSPSLSDTITITVGIAANVAGSVSAVTATVGSAGFSSNVTSPLTITVDTAPAGVVTTGAGVSAGAVELESTGSATTNFAISAGTTIGTISVVTQGATGLDFSNAGSGTCTATTYGSASACTVNVTFSPTHPGPRLGAVKILDGSGNLLATQYVTAIGVAPQVIFSPGVQSALGGGFSQPYGVATDSSGNVYVADQANNAVKKIPSGCTSSSCVVTLGGGFSGPYGIAVDGAGNVVVGDSGNFLVKLIPAGCVTSTCVVALGGPMGNAGVAVDGDGNVFVADNGDDLVIEIPQGCFASGCTILLGGGFSVPAGIATDGNGNLFVADEGNGAVKELAITCLTSGCVSEVGGGISQPYSVAVDASGNIFVGDQGSTAIRKIPSGCTSSSCVSTLSGTFAQPFGVALDGSGNLFVANASATTVAKLDFANPLALSYTSTQVGSSSSAQAVTVSNDGNAALDFTSSGLTAPTDFAQASGSGTPPDCANSGTVTAGASCNLGIKFRPSSTGAHAESFVLTDNDLNVSAATQSIAVSGTGLAAETGLTSTSTVLTASPNPASEGQSVTFTATVSPAPTGSSLGSVSFYNGETLLGTASVNSAGVATFSAGNLPGGTLSITAVYSGNTGFAGSTSAVLTETVNTAYTVTAPSTPFSAAQGGAVQIDVTVPPLGGAFNHLVTMSASGLPPGATATFNPPTVTPGANGAPTVMTIQLAPLAAALFDPGSPPGRHFPLRFLLGSVLLVLGLCGAGFAQKRSPRLRVKAVLGFAVLLCLALTMIGCGGGFLSPPTTPANTYVVTITGTSGALHASTTVTVVVQ
jgi:streptogramin lyase